MQAVVILVALGSVALLGALGLYHRFVVAGLRTQLARFQEREIASREQQASTANRLVQLQARLHQRERLATLGQRITDVIHDLSNPLSTILGMSQLLLRNADLPPPLQHDLNVIVLEATRTRQVISDLRAFVRQQAPAPQICDLNNVVLRALALHSHQFGTQTIDIQIQLSSNLPPINADPLQLQHALLNLLVNAENALIKCTQDGHDLSRASLSLTTAYRAGNDVSPGAVVVLVAGSAVDMPTALHEQVFEPVGAIGANSQDTGSSLAIAAGIVRDQGGLIRVVREEALGTTMEIALPVGQQAVAEQSGSDPLLVAHQ